MKNVFSYSSYNTYLSFRFKAERGLKAKASKVMGIQTSYLSRVLNHQADLSLEQAFTLNDFFYHDSQEAEFFLLLVQKDRAGTKALKDYFFEKINKVIEQRSQLKSRLEIKEELSPLEQAKYYSHWIYSAIHMVCSVPGLNKKESLHKVFNLPPHVINEVIDFLTKAGLLIENKDGYELGSSHIHLPSDSPFILQHHANWRQKCIREFDYHKPDDFHYSAVFSLSEVDAKIIRERILEVVQQNIKTVIPSKEEVVYCSLIDFFKLA
ncbi:MAG: TIGR02147 family protein [Bdellovibrionales bacterium]|nr:TIGR02147 family protein [Bdellovibrionales bacterium]